MGGVPPISRARGLARDFLAPLTSRWLHVQAVAARAEQLSVAVTGAEERQLLVVAAWWHDLGYAPELRDLGVHQIDGARHLERQGYPERLVALVAHHSAAPCEMTERGLSVELQAWPREDSPVADALWTADMTTGPRGEELTYDERLSEVLGRYGRDSTVARSMLTAEPAVRAAIDRTRQRMNGLYTI